ncbi:hypothetical protein COCNU_scaffold007987G000010 [Cocos nucifera]|nr:hypothetical protein [Cocos nucifera]
MKSWPAPPRLYICYDKLEIHIKRITVDGPEACLTVHINQMMHLLAPSIRNLSAITYVPRYNGPIKPPCTPKKRDKMTKMTEGT